MQSYKNSDKLQTITLKNKVKGIQPTHLSCNFASVKLINYKKQKHGENLEMVWQEGQDYTCHA
jgi:hypothetical protein